MPLYFNKLAILAKIETTAGTDSVPTGAANAILVSDAVLTPIEQEQVPRNLVRSFLGNSESLVVANWMRAEFTVEMAGSGTAGTAPAWGPLLRGCNMSQTISAGVSVTYAPAGGTFDRLTIYANLDGVLHAMTYSAGTPEWDFTARGRPTCRFNFTGLFRPVVDAAVPAAVYTAFQRPLAVNNANTPTFNLAGTAARMRSLKFGLRNGVVYRNLVGFEGVDAPDRQPAGTLSIEAGTVAQRNVWAGIAAGTTGALQLVHGLTAGNILEINMPSVKLMNPKYTADSNVAMLDVDLEINPVSGNDEMLLIAR